DRERAPPPPRRRDAGAGARLDGAGRGEGRRAAGGLRPRAPRGGPLGGRRQDRPAAPAGLGAWSFSNAQDSQRRRPRGKPARPEGGAGKRRLGCQPDLLRELLAHARDVRVDLLDVGAAIAKQVAHEHEPLQLQHQIVELAELTLGHAASSTSSGSTSTLSSSGVATCDSTNTIATAAASSINPAST